MVRHNKKSWNKKCIKEGHLPRHIVNESTKQEINEFIMQKAQNKHT